MTQLKTVTAFFDSLLEVHSYQDSALNGLQVDSGRAEVSCVAFAVDAGQSVIEEAIQRGAELLVVHHGLYWGSCEPVTGPIGRKIRTLISRGCSLYASHLPLDGNTEVGNGFELARYLGLEDISG